MRQWLLWLLTAFPASHVLPQTYVTEVSVLDVEKQKIIPGQTVVIGGDCITAIGPSKKIKPASGASIIDGTGKFLMPGMTDAHVHFFQSGGLYARPDAIDLRKYMPYETEIAWVHQNMEDFLRRYLQNGITAVVDVGSTLNFLQQKDTFRSKSYAPAIYMTGPLITTYEPAEFKNLKNDEPFFEVKTADEARAMVQKQLPFKPDFIKIWYIVALGNNAAAVAREYLPLIKAAIEEAHKYKLRVAVHATERIAAQLAVENGCDYLVHGVDDELVDDKFLDLLKKNNVVLCPTLVVSGNYSKVFAQQTTYTYFDLMKSNPIQLASLSDLKHLPDTYLLYREESAGKQNVVLPGKSDSVRMMNLKKMVDAGIVIATGTDAGNIGTLHASSYFDELKAMRLAGLSNWQIIQSSTINGAKAVGKEKEWGSIAVGKYANMILLNANPVADLDNLQEPDLVINKGTVIKPDTLIQETALSLVTRQLNGYNAHNADAFLEPYSDDIELYNFPDKLLCKGKAEMRKQYQWFDKIPDLHCEIKNRMTQGNIVIDKESVTGTGDKPLETTVIYHIDGNKIKRVYFIR